MPTRHGFLFFIRAVVAAACIIAWAGKHNDAFASEVTGMTSFASACAEREVEIITLIEDHGHAGDLPSNKLGEAGLKMLDARIACYRGHVSEALALYDSIRSLGPVLATAR